MNNYFNEINNNLNKVFKEFDISDEIKFSLSKLKNYDLQINDLIRYKNNKFFNDLQEEIVKILKESNLFLKVEVNSHGFINLSFNHQALFKNISNGSDEFKKDELEKIIIDYGGPNIGKPLHVGHMRTLNIGRSLYNIHSFIGNNIVSDLHLGDWGMPVAQIITYLEKEKIDINTLEAKQLEIIYPKASEEYKTNNDFKTRAQEINKRLNNNDQALIEIWKIIKNISMQSLENNFKLFNHSFDYWLGESDVNNLIPDMIDELQKNKKIINDEGALISAEDTDPKILITKSDGSYLYITTDLATILYRQKYIGYDMALYVVDNRQALHFNQLFSSIKFFDFNNLKHKHIAYGTLNDSEGNPFKTRDGGTKPLSELYQETYDYIREFNTYLDSSIISQLTNSVLTYSDLITNRKTDYKFNLEKFTNVYGKTGIYVQYSQVRAKKLLENFKNSKNGLNELILNELDKELLSRLFLFGYFLEQSASLNEPHHLANYLYEISNLFNQFYESEKILEIDNSNHLSSKMYITNLFLTTSQNVMWCLGITPVNQM